jgi:hypothetical protein
MELETILERIRELKKQQIQLGEKIENWKEKIKNKTDQWNLNLSIEVKH